MEAPSSFFLRWLLFHDATDDALIGIFNQVSYSTPAVLLVVGPDTHAVTLEILSTRWSCEGLKVGRELRADDARSACLSRTIDARKNQPFRHLCKATARGHRRMPESKALMKGARARVLSQAMRCHANGAVTIMLVGLNEFA